MIFKKDHNLLKKDTWLKIFFYPRKTFWFDNLQDYSSDGSSNDAYNIFFYAFWGVSFVATVLWVLIFALLFSLIFFDKNIKMNPFIDIIGSILSIYPIDIIILIFIISSICMYRPMQKIKPMQNQKSIQKKTLRCNALIVRGRNVKNEHGGQSNVIARTTSGVVRLKLPCNIPFVIAWFNIGIILRL